MVSPDISLGSTQRTEGGDGRNNPRREVLKMFRRFFLSILPYHLWVYSHHLPSRVGIHHFAKCQMVTWHGGKAGMVSLSQQQQQEENREEV